MLQVLQGMWRPTIVPTNSGNRTHHYPAFVYSSGPFILSYPNQNPQLFHSTGNNAQAPLLVRHDPIIGNKKYVPVSGVGGPPPPPPPLRSQPQLQQSPPATAASLLPRRIPCRARGLTDGHNKETAYFEIPHDAPHGMVVRCSRRECYGTDRGFRYCSVCKRQVAHRNFLHRHGHGIITSHEQLKAMAKTTSPAPLGTASVICNTSATTCISIAATTRTTVNQSTSENYVKQQQQQCSDFVASGNVNSKHNINNTFCTMTDSPSSSRLLRKNQPGLQQQQPQHPSLDHDSRILSDTDKKWLSLLRDRPENIQDSESMEPWVQRIMMHSSNSSTSINECGTKSDGPSGTASLLQSSSECSSFPSGLNASDEVSTPSLTSMAERMATASTTLMHPPTSIRRSTNRRKRKKSLSTETTTRPTCPTPKPMNSFMISTAKSPTLPYSNHEKEEGSRNDESIKLPKASHDSSTNATLVYSFDRSDHEEPYDIDKIFSDTGDDDFSNLFH